jgi:hypothetical protein
MGDNNGDSVFVSVSVGRHTSHAEQRQDVNINMFDHGHALRPVLPTLGVGGGCVMVQTMRTQQTRVYVKNPFYMG